MTALLLLALAAALPPLDQRLDAAARQEFAGQYEQALAAVRTACTGRESDPRCRLLEIRLLERLRPARRADTSTPGAIELAGPARLDNPAITPCRMVNQPAAKIFETLARVAGAIAIIDPDLANAPGRGFTVELPPLALDEALDHAALITHSFWKPLGPKSFFVTLDNPTKRRDHEDLQVRTFYLRNVTTPAELNEILTVVRTLTDVRRMMPYNGQMAVAIRATGDQIRLAEKLLIDLDKPKPEVLVEVLVLEASESASRTLAASLTNSSGAGLQLGVSAKDSALSLARLGKLSTNNFAVSLPGAIVQALKTESGARVLQNPTIRTLDLQKATLKIGDRYPYASGSFSSGANAVNTNALVNTQFQFADVGVNVDLVPKVHDGGEITLHLEVDVSNIRDQIDIGGLRQPVIGQRKFQQDVRLREGEVTLLSGLTQSTATESIKGIPGLSKLPIASLLSGSRAKDGSRAELLIALIPRLVRAPEIGPENLRPVAAGTEVNVKVNERR